MTFSAAMATVFGRRQTKDGHPISAADRAIRAAANEYVAWLLVLVVGGGVVGALVGTGLGYIVTYLLALLAAVGAVIAAVLVACLVGIAAGSALLLIVLSGAFLYALCRLASIRVLRAWSRAV
jgi:uncharacterized membrane protein YfcA